VNKPFEKRFVRNTGDLVILLIGVLFLIPFVWVVVSAFKPNANLSIVPLHHFTLKNFTELLSDQTKIQSFLNSIYISLGTMGLTTAIAVMAAYPLSRFKFRLKQGLITIMIFATGLPVVALMVPVYDFYVSYNLINSMFWTVMFMTATSLPFSTWIMKGFIDSVPFELEESALVEGCNTFQAFVKVVVPLIIPGASVVAMYTFVNAWGNFIVPFILLQSPKLPAAVTMYSYFSQYSVNYSGLAAFSIVYTVPAVLLYVIITKWLGGGFALGGAVKG
jgi:multiple sugar transport system permease protein